MKWLRDMRFAESMEVGNAKRTALTTPLIPQVVSHTTTCPGER